MWATPASAPSTDSWEALGITTPGLDPVLTWTTATRSQTEWVLIFPDDPEREAAYRQYLVCVRGNQIVNTIHSPIDPKTIYLMPNDQRWIFLDKIMYELVKAWGWIYNISKPMKHPEYGVWSYVSITDRWNTLLKRWFVTDRSMHLETEIVGLDIAKSGRPRGWAGYRWTSEETWAY